MNLQPVPQRSGMDSLREIVFDNPMLDESKRAQRKFFPRGRTGITIGFLLFWILYIWIVIEAYLEHADQSDFYCVAELVLMTLILPASIYNAVSGEREKGTWDALILTRLTAAQIVYGKLVWRFRIILTIGVLLLIPICVSRMDVTSEITNGKLILGQTMILSWSILLTTFGLWVSSVTRKSVTSLAVMAITLVCCLILLPALYSLFFSALGASNVDNDFSFQVLWGMNPFYAIVAGLNPYENESAGSLFQPPGFWQSVIYLLFSAVFVALSLRRLRQLEQPSQGAR